MSKRKGDFYRSRVWRHVRREALRVCHYECQRCKAMGKLTRATVVHHDLPRDEYPEYELSLYKPDGSLNLIPLCFDCHEEIERERGNRGNYEKKTELLTDEWW